MLTQREFERYYRATGVDADAATVFSELDADGSGSLSKDELTEYIVDFMLSETSDSRGSVLLGTG
ncbi:hypothetical protein SAMN04487905_12510 [Actinopolyspora xinjiangensis]|uniref:EF-hand domain-containing protein n=1 Tax=Actinopolyspora xinjiangensis TaxID=405564 RepID=A0A1H0X2Z5_9ACTN|nr:hypothetical protein SAMN04487905_12510 [Actinopolyspora xinjiangensis]